jgi:hypothetical protein
MEDMPAVSVTVAAAVTGTRPPEWADPFPDTVLRPTLPVLACLALIAATAPALAQVQTFTLGPGSNVGPSTRIVPTNCVTGADGSVTCDTRIENSPTDTPAKPQIQRFKN